MMSHMLAEVSIVRVTRPYATVPAASKPATMSGPSVVIEFGAKTPVAAVTELPFTSVAVTVYGASLDVVLVTHTNSDAEGE